MSAELRVWLVKDEVNTVAVELVGMRAGVLPVELQWFRSLDEIAEAVRDRNMDVSWYRHDGHLVGVFRLYADQPRPQTQLGTVTVADGRVTVAGRSMVDAGGRPSVCRGQSDLYGSNIELTAPRRPLTRPTSSELPPVRRPRHPGRADQPPTC